MHPVVWSGLYLSVLSCSFLALGLLMRYSVTMKNEKQLDLNLMVSSWTSMVFWGYYMMFQLAKMCCSNQRQKTFYDRREPNSEYNNLQMGETEILKGRPRLHISDVWIFVYGIGLSFYTMNYVLTNIDVLSTQVLAYALFLVVIYEIGISPKPICHSDNAMYMITCFIPVTAMLIKGADIGFPQITNPFKHADSKAVVYGWLLPMICASVFVNIKREQRYSFGDLYDLCELGFPFTFILACMTAVLNQWYTNSDLAKSMFIEPHVPVTILLSPLALLLIYVLVIEAVIKNHVLDPLLCLGFATSFLDLLQDSGNQIALVSFILSACAIVIRLSALMSIYMEENKHKNIAQRVSSRPSSPQAVHVIEDIEDYVPESEETNVKVKLNQA